jgi:hypothetical protein
VVQPLSRAPGRAARRELREAPGVVETFEQREPIESAMNHVQTISDQAYFYAGVAFGVTLADVRSAAVTFERPRASAIMRAC